MKFQSVGFQFHCVFDIWMMVIHLVYLYHDAKYWSNFNLSTKASVNIPAKLGVELKRIGVPQFALRVVRYFSFKFEISGDWFPWNKKCVSIGIVSSNNGLLNRDVKLEVNIRSFGSRTKAKVRLTRCKEFNTWDEISPVYFLRSSFRYYQTAILEAPYRQCQFYSCRRRLSLSLKCFGKDFIT